MFFVPISWAVAMAPHFAKAVLIAKATSGDNSNTTGRLNLEDFKGSMEKKQFERASRLAAAHTNGFESMIFFAPGVVAAVAAGAPRSATNAICGVHVGLRILYNIVYASAPVWNGYVRSAVFVGSSATSAVLWILAGIHLDD